MTTTHDKLTALSEAATQGPWVAGDGNICGKDFGYTVALLEYAIEDENERGSDDIALAVALVNAWRDGTIVAVDGPEVDGLVSGLKWEPTPHYSDKHFVAKTLFGDYYIGPRKSDGCFEYTTPDGDGFGEHDQHINANLTEAQAYAAVEAHYKEAVKKSLIGVK